MGSGSSTEKDVSEAQRIMEQAALHTMTPEKLAMASYEQKSFASCLRLGPPKNISASAPAVEPPVAGFHNYGNTCYANSVVQMLFHTPCVRHHIASRFAGLLAAAGSGGSQDGKESGSGGDQQSGNSNGNKDTNSSDSSVKGKASDKESWRNSIWFELASLYARITIQTEKAAASNQAKPGSADPPVMEPRDFIDKIRKACPMFANREQHDAHEFALTLLNCLFDEERQFVDEFDLEKAKSQSEKKNNGNGNNNDKYAKPKTLQAMTGHSVTQTCCIECDTTTIIKETLIDCSCVLEPKSSLRHVSQAFTNYELLTGENKFRCDCCGSSCVARRRTMISEPAPKFLLLQLKRFRYTNHGVSKLSDFIPFSDKLRVPVYDTEHRLVGSQQYRLCAFVVHSGTYPMAGHYFCIAYHRPTKQWMLLNDTKASIITEREMMKFLGTCSDIHSEAAQPVSAYVLSYERDDDAVIHEENVAANSAKTPARKGMTPTR